MLSLNIKHIQQGSKLAVAHGNQNVTLKRRKIAQLAIKNFSSPISLNYHLSICIVIVFSSPDPKGHVSYCHHLASVVVVRRKLFQKSSPLKVLDQWKPNLV